MKNRKNEDLNEKIKNKNHSNNSPASQSNNDIDHKDENNTKITKEESDSDYHERPTEEKPNDEDQLQEEIITLKEEKLRLLAEMENLRKRFEREKKELIKFGSINLLREILQPGDNLERALAAIPNNEKLPQSIKNLIDGLKMVQKEFYTILKKNGVIKIESLNKKFDHNYHQAMMEIEKEEIEEGTVVLEIQAGYTMNDRLLRPAMVGVSKKPIKEESKKNNEKTNNKNEIKSGKN